MEEKKKYRPSRSWRYEEDKAKQFLAFKDKIVNEEMLKTLREKSQWQSQNFVHTRTRAH